MKRNTFLLVLLITGILYGQTPSNDQHWQLVWNDEFNALDVAKWLIKNNQDHNLSTSCCDEIQVYTSRVSNVFCNDGNLTLRAINESYSCPPTDINQWNCVAQYVTGEPYNFTSGWVESKYPFFADYGYLEARIKLPYGYNFFPAFWTWTGNPNYQEIDVFEMTPGHIEACNRSLDEIFPHTNYIATSNIHYSQPANQCDDPNAAPSVYKIADYTQWHTYSIEWSPSRIIWYLDESPIRYYHNVGINSPATVIFNLALRTTEAVFPADMLIDYVRYYELIEDCNAYINATRYDFANHNNVEKNFIKIGSSGGVNYLESGQDIKLRASQFIEISGDFDAPLGTSLYLDVNQNCSSDLGLECTMTFNPCAFDFSLYDNTVKRLIMLGDNECNIYISSSNSDIIFQASDEIIIKPDVSIFSSSGHNVDLLIVPCP